MQKRGQVTIFIVIGIVILFVSALSIYLYKSSSTKNFSANQEQTIQLESIKTNLQQVLEQCLEQRAAEGIYLVSIQGGIIYPDKPEEMLITDNANIQYASINDKILLSKENIEQQISKYITQTDLHCDFSSFLKEGVQITEPKIESTKTTINNKKIILTTQLTFEAKIASSTIQITTLQTQLPLALGNLIEQAKNIIQKQQQNFSQYQPTQTKENYFITYFPYDEITSIYSISDKESLYNNAPLTFMFALRFDNTNYPPTLAHIPDFTLQPNSKLEYQLSATDPDSEPLTFYSTSNKIPITSEGIIAWTPTTPDIIITTFGVKDSHGLTDEQQVRILVQK